MNSLLFLGDIVGRVGRRAVKECLPRLRARFNPDFVIANGENAAGGFGITIPTAKEILASGVDLITTGNHIWDHRDAVKLLEKEGDRVLRPANFPLGTPGSGFSKLRKESGITLGVMNLMGRVFMHELLRCPFQEAEVLLSDNLTDCDAIFVDIHAEATSEKLAFAHFVDGRVTAVIGTHTHIPTADCRILPKGTAFQCDAGMCGPSESIIGMETKGIIARFLETPPPRMEVPKKGKAIISGTFIRFDGKQAEAIERFSEFID